MGNKNKRILTIAGSLILGAFGSGLWSGVLSPVGSFLGQALMSILTLGMTSARDSIYDRVARGFSERPSVVLLTILGATFLYIPMILLTSPRIFSAFQRWLPRRPGNSGRTQLKWLRRINFWLAITAFFMGAVIFVQILFLGYTNTVVARFNQTLAIASPYISAEQRTVFLARFASMRTRKDFILLFDELNKIAESHGQPRSNFSPW